MSDGSSRRAALLGVLVALAGVTLGGGCFHHIVLVVQDARGDSAENVRPKTPRLCGNAICDDSRGESCTSCPADCGRCRAGKTELVAVEPESGPANRWIALFGTNLDGVKKIWLVSGAPPGVACKLRRAGTRLEIFVPAGSKGGAIHVQVGAKRTTTPLRYTVRPE